MARNIHCTQRTKRLRDMLAAKLGVDKQEALEAAVELAMEESDKLQRTVNREKTHRGGLFQGGFMG